MNFRMRLGPAAIFLCIVSMIIVTLTLLTVSTVNADRAMADRFASVTQTRYSLKADGERFLSEAAAAGIYGREPAGAEAAEDGYLYEKEANGYKLEIEISRPDSEGRFEVRSYHISRIWKTDDPTAEIWKGEGTD